MKIMLIAVLLSQFAHADFNGDWKGTGQLINGEVGDVCPDAEVALTQSSTQFVFGQYHFDCGSAFLSPELDFPMEVKAGYIFYDGKNVGTIDDSSFHIIILDVGGKGDSLSLDGILNNGVLKVTEDFQSREFRQIGTYTLSR